MLKCLNVKMNKGLTLIEILVTALIFSIIIGASMGVFISSIRLQKYNLTHQEILNQTSYALGYMDRAIRMSIKDDGTCGFAGQNYNVAGESIEFATYHDPTQCWRFFTMNEQLLIDKDGTVYYLTSSDFSVTDFDITVTGDSLGDNIQPKVQIYIRIEGNILGDNPKVEIQTSISKRNLDL